MIRAHRDDDYIEGFVASTDKVVIILDCHSPVDRVELEAGGIGLDGLEGELRTYHFKSSDSSGEPFPAMTIPNVAGR